MCFIRRKADNYSNSLFLSKLQWNSTASPWWLKKYWIISVGRGSMCQKRLLSPRHLLLFLLKYTATPSPLPRFTCLEVALSSQLLGISSWSKPAAKTLLHTKCSIFSRGSSFFLLIAAGAHWHWDGSPSIHLAPRWAHHDCGCSLLDIV